MTASLPNNDELIRASDRLAKRLHGFLYDAARRSAETRAQNVRRLREIGAEDWLGIEHLVTADPVALAADAFVALVVPGQVGDARLVLMGLIPFLADEYDVQRPAMLALCALVADATVDEERLRAAFPGCFVKRRDTARG